MPWQLKPSPTDCYLLGLTVNAGLITVITVVYWVLGFGFKVLGLGYVHVRRIVGWQYVIVAPCRQRAQHCLRPYRAAPAVPVDPDMSLLRGAAQ